MIARNFVPFLLVGFFCLLLGAILGVRQLADDRTIALLAEKYLNLKDIGNFKELSSVLPEKLALFVYVFDRKLAFFGALAGLGILLAGLTIRLAAQTSRAGAEGVGPDSNSSLKT
jgi:hypothetical protein